MVCIDCKNLLFGRVKFISLEFPKSWRAGPLPKSTDVRNWIRANGERWVTEGYAHLAVSVPGSEQPLVLYIEAKKSNNATVRERLGRARRKIKEEMLRELGTFEMNGHKASYILYERKWKKYFLFGRENREMRLDISFNCDETRRTILIRASSEIPGYLGGDPNNLKVLLDVLSASSCH